MFVIKRKNIVIGLLVALLIITGYLNLIYNNNVKPTSRETNGGGSKTADIISGDVSVTDPNTEQEPKSQGLVQETSSANFFIDYRFEREKNRNNEMEYINTVLDDPEADADLTREAHALLLELASNMEAEAVIENLLKAKGFTEAIAIIHKNNVNIIVNQPELLSEEVAQILEVVKRESEFSTDNIVITPKK